MESQYLHLPPLSSGGTSSLRKPPSDQTLPSTPTTSIKWIRAFNNNTPPPRSRAGHLCIGVGQLGVVRTYTDPGDPIFVPNGVQRRQEVILSPFLCLAFSLKNQTAPIILGQLLYFQNLLCQRKTPNFQRSLNIIIIMMVFLWIYTDYRP